jgi:hypothetical protein
MDPSIIARRKPVGVEDLVFESVKPDLFSMARGKLMSSHKCPKRATSRGVPERRKEPT